MARSLPDASLLLGAHDLALPTNCRAKQANDQQHLHHHPGGPHGVSPQVGHQEAPTDSRILPLDARRLLRPAAATQSQIVPQLLTSLGVLLILASIHRVGS